MLSDYQRILVENWKNCLRALDNFLYLQKKRGSQIFLHLQRYFEGPFEIQLAFSFLGNGLALFCRKLLDNGVFEITGRVFLKYRMFQKKTISEHNYKKPAAELFSDKEALSCDK